MGTMDDPGEVGFHVTYNGKISAIKQERVTPQNYKGLKWLKNMDGESFLGEINSNMFSGTFQCAFFGY